ncbi:MAG: hypothetical protein GFH27_549287n95 [Chloroflexi bacterium AL-W]|nr:hypothetical protein [Chloroflexi bacterium AL-N1]NOK66369.1 hypothetical protein [Chloroflexi bacterium AL-N10]NOK71757.1 hypothetical protein [Chloroflexi bacterium AL-N5]NOK81014.1 hypothetical protein [Chloroflexi bacterium AL-W]NOK89287.1 hypothetical protein [Chloroflexi bacterium AL-N15]
MKGRKFRMSAILLGIFVSLVLGTSLSQAATTTANLDFHRFYDCVDSPPNKAVLFPGSGIPSFGSFNNLTSSFWQPAGTYDSTLYASINYQNSFWVIGSSFSDDYFFKFNGNLSAFDDTLESARSR